MVCSVVTVGPMTGMKAIFVISPRTWLAGVGVDDEGLVPAEGVVAADRDAGVSGRQGDGVVGEGGAGDGAEGLVEGGAEVGGHQPGAQDVGHGGEGLVVGVVAVALGVGV